MVVGVTQGYEKVLEVNGVGYRAAKSGNKLTLNLGYFSSSRDESIRKALRTVLEGQNKITVKRYRQRESRTVRSRDQRTREDRSRIRAKGIKYADEVIRRKVGKTGKK